MAKHEDLPFNLPGEVDLPIAKSLRFTCESKSMQEIFLNVW